MAEVDEETVPRASSSNDMNAMPSQQALDLSTSGNKTSGSPNMPSVRRDNPAGPWELSPQATSITGLPGGSMLRVHSTSPGHAVSTQQLSPDTRHLLHNRSSPELISKQILHNRSSPELISKQKLLQTAPQNFHSQIDHQPYALHSSTAVLMDENLKEAIDVSRHQTNRMALGQPAKKPYDMLGADNPFMYGPTLNGPVGSPPVNLASVAALTSLYDCPPHQASISPSPMSPLSMTSYVLSKKRRQEARDRQTDREPDLKQRKPTKQSSTVPSESSSQSGSEESDNKKVKTVPEEKKDDAYWERRRKNNEAAKRSRDARRQKEEEIAMRAAFLEQENLKLRAQITVLKNETAKLHYLLYNSRT